MLLTAVVGLHRFSYYGARALIPSAVSSSLEAGRIDQSQAQATYEEVKLLTTFAPLAGGVLALLLGARVTLVVGAALLAGSSLLLSGASPISTLALFVFALGHGCLLPTAYALAAGRFGPGDRAARLSLFAGLYLAVTLGSTYGPPLAGSLVSTAGWAGALSIFLLPGVILAGAATALVFLLPAAEKTPLSAPKNRLIGLVLLALGASWFWFSYIANLSVLQELLSAWSDAGQAMPWYWSAGPALVSALALVAALGLGLAQKSSYALPRTATFLAAGLLVGWAGFTLQLVAPSPGDGGSPGLFLLPAVLCLSLAELLLVPLLLVASEFGERLGALVVAVFFVGTTGGLFTDFAAQIGEQAGTVLWVVTCLGVPLAIALWAFRAKIGALIGEVEGHA